MTDAEIRAALGGQRNSPVIRAVANLLAFEQGACTATAENPANASDHGTLAHATGGSRAIANIISQLAAATEMQGEEVGE